MASDPLKSQIAPVQAQAPTAAEDQARAGVYALLGSLLRDVPGADLLRQVALLEPATGRDGFALAWEGLRLSAASVEPGQVDDEYHRLFLGLGRGELVPYGSWYQTGFLMERPLGELRQDLQALGFERQDGVCEPEDHVAALCEVMAQLAQDPGSFILEQMAFYRAHLGPWINAFFADLDKAESAVFYKALARLGNAFFELENRYLEMDI